MLKYIFIFLSLWLSLSVCAQDDVIYSDSSLLPQDEVSEYEESLVADEAMEEIIPDTSFVLYPRSVPADSITTIRSGKEFRYVRNLDSLLKAEKEADASNLRAAGRSISLLDRIFNAPWLQILFWLIAAAVVIFILIKLVSTNGMFSRSARKSDVEEEMEEVEDHVPQDFDSLIAEYSGNGDYRSATKYLFLRSLHMLSERSLINFAPDKTNDQYWSEIPAYLKSGFRKISIKYEYVWYGKRSVSAGMYDTIVSEFSAFDKTI